MTVLEQMKKEFSVSAVKDIGPSTDAPYGKVSGYAATFGGPDRDGDCINAGAFGQKSFEVPLLAFHDRSRPIGKAVCTPMPQGLWTDATFIDTPDAQNVRKAMAGGAVPAFSFFGTSKSYDPNQHGGVDYNQLEIMEVSAVTIPANPKALVATVKSYQDMAAEKQYADVEPPAGSYEAVQEDIREALVASYGGRDVYVSITATFPDSVVYTVEHYDDPTMSGTYQSVYIRSNDEVTFGAPKAVEIQQTIVAEADSEMEPAFGKSLKTLADKIAEVQKAGQRNSGNDQKYLDQAHEAIVKAGGMCAGVEKSHAPFASGTIAASAITSNSLNANTITSFTTHGAGAYTLTTPYDTEQPEVKTGDENELSEADRLTLLTDIAELEIATA